MAKTLQVGLRNYLLAHNIPLAFVNVEKSMISMRYDGRSNAPDHLQVLVLEKPSDWAFEIEDLSWSYPARTMLLIFNKELKTTKLISLEFKFKLPGKTEETEFNFSGYKSLMIKEDHFLLADYGREINDNGQCLNVALLTIEGKVISVWQAESINSYEYKINDFNQLNQNNWIANISFNSGENHRMVHKLHLFSLNQIQTYNLSLNKELHSKVGFLLAAKTSEIYCWFSEESDGISDVFVLASHYQCCIYRYHHNHGYFNKIAEIALDGYFINDVNKTVLTDDGITVSFDSKQKDHPSSSFYLAFRK